VEPVDFHNFIVRLAESDAEVEAAQRLRYQVFYEEMAAKPTPAMRLARRDFDSFDAICDHLLVIDKDAPDDHHGVVGTYRLLRRSVAESNGGFYTQQEYDISALLQAPGEFVELGRSCVESGHRNRGVMQMLWRGLAAYVHHFDINLMFGCASFPGTDLADVGQQLSYLYHHHMAPQPLRPRALEERYVFMGHVPPGGIDEQAVLNEMPPLIKGYLRVGGFVGDGAVIDRQFNTTDVCVIVKTDQLTEKYERRYRKAAAA
jgi:putative hemolysin